MTTSNLETKEPGTLEGFGLPIYLRGGTTLTVRTEGEAAEPPGRTAVRRIVVGEPEASQHDYAVCALRLF